MLRSANCKKNQYYQLIMISCA